MVFCSTDVRQVSSQQPKSLTLQQQTDVDDPKDIDAVGNYAFQEIITWLIEKEVLVELTKFKLLYKSNPVVYLDTAGLNQVPYETTAEISDPGEYVFPWTYLAQTTLALETSSSMIQQRLRTTRVGVAQDGASLAQRLREKESILSEETSPIVMNCLLVIWRTESASTY